MIIEGDAKGLEVVCAAFMSQDPVLCQELRDGVDIHGINQERFGLPKRVTAKILKFRILYGGTEYGFVHDSDFSWISTSVDYWRRIIEEYYSKYSGIARWHTNLVQAAMERGEYISPTGRRYSYKPYKNKRGEVTWPRTQILNYPVQGFGTDLMSIARVSAHKRLKDRVKFINSVHDSILVDSPNEIVYDVCPMLEDVFKDVPKNFEKLFGTPFNLPMSGEVKYGPNWKDMQEYKRG